MKDLRAAFYGDDLTGSTDALAQFHRAGLRGLLVTNPAALRLAEGYDVAGIAGIARSLPTDDMEAEVRPALEALRGVTQTVVQYKVCSTADSSPVLGSLGRAIEIGRSVFGPVPVPVLIAQPDLGRYTAFGNHFAVEGGVVYRLDRQPTMSRHPATPMTEADLRLHIARQTSLPVASVDLCAYDDLPGRYRAAAGEAPGLIVFDAMDNGHLLSAAQTMLAAATDRPFFALGSGGLSYALGSALTGSTTARPEPAGDGAAAASPVTAGPVSRLLVVSGSRSPRTASQIRWARDHGWCCLSLREGPPRLLRERLLAGLDSAPGAVVYSSAGEDDAVDAAGSPMLDSIGEALGYLAREALDARAVSRLVVAGGDTSGRVLRSLGAEAMEILTILGPGLPLCTLRGPDPVIDGAQAVFKGGQLGPAELFGLVRSGRDITATTVPP